MSGRCERLRLRPASGPPAEARAWLLPGQDPRRWLEGLASWGRPLLGLRCALLPGADGQGWSGLLVLSPKPGLGAPSPRALPYRCLGLRLYLPADAEPWPRPRDSELDELPGELLVLHPLAGLVAFDGGDLLGPAQLLEPPPRRTASWDVAGAGPPPLPSLQRVRAARPASLERLFAQARGEIGVARLARPREESTQQPPAAPGEEAPQTPAQEGQEGAEDDAQGVGGWIRRQARRLAEWARGRPAGEEPAPAQPEPEAVDAAGLHRSREQELQRLARLLEEDPDRGLRYALPLHGSEGRRRGPQAPPGRRLPERELKLNLEGSRGGGSRPRDPWLITPDLHMLLLRRYREAADRELSLGRYERAAYVYLELLGDVRAAAQALERGRRYREAALLYAERLRQPLEAARCLERGGLLDEAAAAYADCGEDERAGELYRQLGRDAQAERHFRRAAASLRRLGDPQGAARILEAKLGASDEALELLAGTWPTHRQAGPCLQDRLALLGRLGRHAEAGRLLQELVDVPAPRWREVALVEVLEGAARGYPEPQVAARARDGARVVAGQRLLEAPPGEAEQLLRVVARLAPEDRLLGRDVGRYVARVRAGSPRNLAVRLGQDRKLNVVEEQRLPPEVRWEVAVAVQRGFYAAGLGPDGLVAVRGRWDGARQVVRWDGRRPSGPLLLAPGAASACPTLLASRGGPAFPMRRFQADELFAESGRIGTAGWLPDHCHALATSPMGSVLVVHGQERLVLSTHDALQEGEILSTRALRGEVGEAGIHALALRDRFFLSVGLRLEWREGEAVVRQLQLDSPATALTASPRDACLVVSHAQGATAFFSRGRREALRLPLARDLPEPRVGFTREGLLAVFSQSEVRCYQVQGRSLVHKGTFPWRGRPLAVLPTRSFALLAVLDRAGRVQLVEVPRS